MAKTKEEKKPFDWAGLHKLLCKVLKDYPVESELHKSINNMIKAVESSQ